MIVCSHDGLSEKANVRTEPTLARRARATKEGVWQIRESTIDKTDDSTSQAELTQIAS